MRYIGVVEDLRELNECNGGISAWFNAESAWEGSDSHDVRIALEDLIGLEAS